MTKEERRKLAFEIMEQMRVLEEKLDAIFDGEPIKRVHIKNEAPSENNAEFSQTQAIFDVIAEHKSGIQKKNIAKAIHDKYGVELSPIQVQNAITYLKKKKNKIVNAGYGRYKAKVAA